MASGGAQQLLRDPQCIVESARQADTGPRPGQGTALLHRGPEQFPGHGGRWQRGGPDQLQPAQAVFPLRRISECPSECPSEYLEAVVARVPTEPHVRPIMKP